MKIPVIIALLICWFSARPAAAGISDGYVPGADGVRIHILYAGPLDAAQSILFLPGHMVSAVIWSKQLNYFAAHGYRVVALDARSQGESSVARGNSPDDRARDLKVVIANLKLTHLTLVGWSQSVQDVAAYVDKFGTGALDRIVLVDSSISMGPEAVKEAPAFVQFVLKGIAVYSRAPRAFCDGMMHAIIGAPTPEKVFGKLDDECIKTPPDISISMLIQDLFTVDRRAVVKKFNKPTLVIASARSLELGAQRQMAASLPEGKFVSVKHAAHAVFFDQPQKFDRLLTNFIEATKHG